MGREARCSLTWAGQSGPGHLLLEADRLILRGALRASFARAGLGPGMVEGDNLVIPTPDGPLRAHLGAIEAERWVKALARPAPGLADKLGIGTDRPAFLLTAITDPDLARALTGCTTDSPGHAAVELAELDSRAGLEALLPALGTRPVWIVTRKGKASPLGDDTARSLLRAAGLIDSKSCAVSPDRTATRYGKRRG